MTRLTAESYEQLIRRSGLVEPKQLERILNQLREKYPNKVLDSEILAERLVEAGYITLWQNQMMIEDRQDSLLGGRHRGFFLGSYKLLSHLGSGGMNTVYLAEHTVMKRRVAIKVLPISGEEDQEFLERFRMESRAIAALDHPNIVSAYDFNNDGQIYYLVMEYIEGKDLHHYVQERGPLPFITAAEFIRQACEGLAHAHKAGLIHRDIKPANLLIDRKKTIKILDLGIARLDRDDNEDSALDEAESGAILGTADYLAPEQALNANEVDARADIYSMGCTLYYLLTGHPPFPKGTLAQRMLAHQMHDPPSIYEDRPSAPKGLVEIVMKMMSKKPEDRYLSANQVEAALKDWLENRDQDAPNGEEDGGTGQKYTSPPTLGGRGPDTIGGRRRKKDRQKKPGDDKITCRTCGTEFGRYMYRCKCPKCGTINHPAAEPGFMAEYDPHDTAAPPSVEASNTPDAPADPNIKASCPKCGSTFTARWSKCLACGAATVLHEGTAASDTTSASHPHEATPPPADTEPTSHARTERLPPPPEPNQVEGETREMSITQMDIATPVQRTRDLRRQPTLDQAAVDVEEVEAAYESSVSDEEFEHKPARAARFPLPALPELPGWVRIASIVTAVAVTVCLLTGGIVMALKSGSRVQEIYPSGAKRAEGSLKVAPSESEGQGAVHQPHGRWVYWFENGQKQEEGRYELGQKVGEWTTWNKDGQIISHGSYQNGQRHGLWEFRYEDLGQLKERGYYVEGQRDGRWTFWHPNGQRSMQGVYENGQRVGDWQFWNKRGELISNPPATAGAGSTNSDAS